MYPVLRRRRGEATAWHMIHLGNLALSGAGMLCIEATAVEPDGRITPGDLGLWDDATEAALKPVLAAIRKHSKIAVTMQLVACGAQGVESCAVGRRSADSGLRRRLVAARAAVLPHKAGRRRRLSRSTPPGLNRIREAFVASARRAARLGIDGTRSSRRARLSAASVPFAARQPSHRRLRRFSLENRMRFPLEIFDMVRASFPADKPVGVRVSASDGLGRGRLVAGRHHRVRTRVEEARLRLDRRIVRRRLAVAEDSARAGLSDSVRQGRQTGDGRSRPSASDSSPIRFTRSN